MPRPSLRVGVAALGHPASCCRASLRATSEAERGRAGPASIRGDRQPHRSWMKKSRRRRRRSVARKRASAAARPSRCGARRGRHASNYPGARRPRRGVGVVDAPERPVLGELDIGADEQRQQTEHGEPEIANELEGDHGEKNGERCRDQRESVFGTQNLTRRQPSTR